jgi:hypothetical protein
MDVDQHINWATGGRVYGDNGSGHGSGITAMTSNRGCGCRCGCVTTCMSVSMSNIPYHYSKLAIGNWQHADTDGPGSVRRQPPEPGARCIVHCYYTHGDGARCPRTPTSTFTQYHAQCVKAQSKTIHIHRPGCSMLCLCLKPSSLYFFCVKSGFG